MCFLILLEHLAMRCHLALIHLYPFFYLLYSPLAYFYNEIQGHKYNLSIWEAESGECHKFEARLDYNVSSGIYLRYSLKDNKPLSQNFFDIIEENQCNFFLPKSIKFIDKDMLRKHDQTLVSRQQS